MQMFLNLNNNRVFASWIVTHTGKQRWKNVAIEEENGGHMESFPLLQAHNSQLQPWMKLKRKKKINISCKSN